jgi:hypothetical protein
LMSGNRETGRCGMGIIDPWIWITTHAIARSEGIRNFVYAKFLIPSLLSSNLPRPPAQARECALLPICSCCADRLRWRWPTTSATHISLCSLSSVTWLLAMCLITAPCDALHQARTANRVIGISELFKNPFEHCITLFTFTREPGIGQSFIAESFDALWAKPMWHSDILVNVIFPHFELSYW